MKAEMDHELPADDAPASSETAGSSSKPLVKFGQPSFFGLLERTTDKDSGEVRYSYLGPRNTTLLRLTIIFGCGRRSDGDYEAVYVDGKRCTFDWHRGLLGPGLALIKRSPQETSSPAAGNPA